MSKLIFACSLFLASCTAGPAVVMSTPQSSGSKTLFVDSQLTTCSGVALSQCMRVRSSANADWTLFYDQIEGFTYEPGFQYELLVKESKVENPPADASGLKTTLVKLIKKEAMVLLKGSEWVYQSKQSQGKSTPVLSGADLTLKFSENQVSGSGGCNAFFGEYSQTGVQLSFKPLASTKKACLNDALNQQEHQYLEQLAKSIRFTRTADTLILEDATGTQLSFKAVK